MAHRLFGRADWLLMVTLLASYAYFFQAGGWNQNSRFDLLRAIVEQRTTRIDDYVANTGDRAELNGHFYSDKAPGQALTALPVAAAWTALVRTAGADPQTASNQAIMAYLSTIWAAGVPTTIAAVALARSTRVLGASTAGAAVAALAYGIASPAWAYATELWGNALTAGCLMVAFAAALALRRPTSRRRTIWLSVLVGVSSGWAIVTEYPAAPAAAITFCLALAHGALCSRERLRRIALFAGLGACAAVAVLVLYNAVSFGSPLFVSYAGVQGFEGMSQGLFGVTLPKRTVLQEILFGQFRGLVPLAPAVALAPFGLILVWLRRDHRAAVAAAVLVPAYYLLFNSAYYYWDGGFSYGPRHVGAALPFLFLGIGPLWTAGARWLKALLGLLVAIGGTLSLMAVATNVLLPEDIGSPLTEVIVPSFLRADLAQNRQSFLQYGTANPAQGLAGAWNLGQLVGLPGLWSLLPLVILWGVCLYVALNFPTRRKCS